MQNEFIQSLQTVTQFFVSHLQNLRACKMSASVLDYQPQNEFHALTKESFSDAFVISSHLLPLSDSMREVCRRLPGQR